MRLALKDWADAWPDASASTSATTAIVICFMACLLLADCGGRAWFSRPRPYRQGEPQRLGHLGRGGPSAAAELRPEFGQRAVVRAERQPAWQASDREETRLD